MSRWMSGFVDIVVLPVLVPLLVYLLFFALKIVAGSADFAGFALLWIMPGAVVRSLTWSAIQHDLILLVLVPVLWTAVAVGVPFFINLMQNNLRPVIIVLCSLAILFVPFAAATAYWALFSQQIMMSIIFFALAAAPMLTSVVTAFRKAGGGG